MAKRWYVIHTYSGYENKVKADLEHRIEAYGLENAVVDIQIPTEEVTEVKDGGERKTSKAGQLPKRTATNIEVGQSVHVISGPLQDFDGTVSEVNPESGKVKVMLTIFGRETPVELTLDQISLIV